MSFVVVNFKEVWKSFRYAIIRLKSGEVIRLVIQGKGRGMRDLTNKNYYTLADTFWEAIEGL